MYEVRVGDSQTPPASGWCLTWARKDTPDDQAALNYAYIHAAKKTGAIVAPVGLAWQQVRQQSPPIDLYYQDGSHPSRADSYLAACVMYAAIFHQSPVDLPSRITGPAINLDTEKVEPENTVVLVDLPRSEAGLLQAAAWQAWQSLENNGGYLDVHPTSAPAPTLSEGEVLSREPGRYLVRQAAFLPGRRPSRDGVTSPTGWKRLEGPSEHPLPSQGLYPRIV